MFSRGIGSETPNHTLLSSQPFFVKNWSDSRSCTLVKLAIDPQVSVSFIQSSDRKTAILPTTIQVRKVFVDSFTRPHKSSYSTFPIKWEGCLLIIREQMVFRTNGKTFHEYRQNFFPKFGIHRYPRRNQKFIILY